MSSVRRLRVAMILLAVAGACGDDDQPEAPAVEPVRVTLAQRVPESHTEGVSTENGAADVGAPLPLGGPVRTDSNTRARVRFGERGFVVLDHDTEIRLGNEAGHLELVRGRLVATVTPVPSGGPALVVETASGTVDVTGTKLALAATDERTTLQVLRGDAQLRNDSGAVEVKTGFEGWVDQGEAPKVAAAVDMAASVAFAELDAEGLEGESTLRGLGELRAHVPGEPEETERALALARHAVNVHIAGNIARTEIEEVFRNDGDEELEGVFAFPLPPGARIASLSLLVDETWEEGAFVDRQRGQRIWQGVIENARREREGARQERIETLEMMFVPGPWRDPALLEWQQGGRFELRIFPIPANGVRKVRLAYEQELAPRGDGHRYLYPLPYASDDSARIGELSVDVQVRAGKVHPWGYDVEMSSEADEVHRLHYEASNFSPTGDLVIDYERAGTPELSYWTWQGSAVARPGGRGSAEERAALAIQSELADDERPYALFAIRPELPGLTEHQQRDYLIVLDASQSMVGERFARAGGLAKAMAGEMDRRDRLMVLACHRRCRASQLLTPGPEAVQAVTTFLEEERPAGATDLDASIRDAIRLGRDAGAGGDRALRVIVVGDGSPSVGPRAAGELAAQMEPLTADGTRITTVGIGQDADPVVLGQIARAGGGHYVPYVPGQRTSAAALDVLETTYGPSLTKVTIDLPDGVEELTPAALPNVHAGQELLVAARMSAESARGDLVLRGKVGGEDFEQRYPLQLAASTSAGNTFVPRQWAGLRIESLALAGRGEDRDRIVALSKGYGVMSRETSLIVLESEAMFEAFGVDRSSPTLQWSGEEDVEEGSVQGAMPVRSARTRTPAPQMRAPSAPRRAAGGGGGINGIDGLGDSAGAASGGGSSGGFGLGQIGGMPRMRRPTRRRVRSATIEASGDVSESVRNAIGVAEAALDENPNSRDAHRSLVRALSSANELERAETAARAWLERDQLDWEALTYLSDAVGRQGRRAESIRLLEGVVDLVPNEPKLHERLANGFDRAGDAAAACAHRVALANVSGYDDDEVANAIRCARANDGSDLADRLLARVTERSREAVTEAAAEDAREERFQGQLTIEASWETSTDLDVSVITDEGTRIWWLGGRTSVVGDDTGSRTGEKLGLQRLSNGRYQVEVSRSDPSDRAPVTGSLQIRAHGESRSIDFELGPDDARKSVASLRASTSWTTGPSPGVQPNVRLGGPQVVGNLDPAIVRRILRQHLNEVRFCYEQRLRTNPNLQGQLVMQMLITPAGTVTQSVVRQNSVGDSAVGSCVAARSRRWRFPQPDGMVRVIAPYAFRSR